MHPSPSLPIAGLLIAGTVRVEVRVGGGCICLQHQQPVIESPGCWYCKQGYIPSPYHLFLLVPIQGTLWLSSYSDSIPLPVRSIDTSQDGVQCHMIITQCHMIKTRSGFSLDLIPTV